MVPRDPFLGAALGAERIFREINTRLVLFNTIAILVEEHGEGVLQLLVLADTLQVKIRCFR